MGTPAKVLSLDDDFRYRGEERARYPEDWTPLRQQILTRMSDTSMGQYMFTITRADTGQSGKLLAFDALDALLKFHGRAFSSRYQCDQVDCRLRATHKETGIEYVITSVEAYYPAHDDADEEGTV